MQLRRRLVLIASTITAGTTVGLLIGEVAARLMPRDRTEIHFGWYSSEDRVLTRLGAQEIGGGITYAYDADGFRMDGPRQVPYDKTVLFIGDSFTDGSGVPYNDTYVAVAERRLRAHGIQARCLSGGANGLGGAQELRLVRTLLARMHVDAVVLEVFPHNDLSDNWEDGGFSLVDGRLVENVPRRPPARRLLRDRLTVNPFVRSSALLRTVVNAVVPAGYFAAPINEESYELERALLAETRATAQRHGVPLLTIVLGDEPAECLNARPDKSFEPYIHVKQMLQSTNVPFIDMCPLTSEPEDYGTVDRHYSVLGYRKVGEAIGDRLTTMLTAKPEVAPPVVAHP